LPLLLILAGGLAWSATPAADDPVPVRHTFTEPHMGTTVRLVVYAADGEAAARAAHAAFARVAELDAVLSDYRPDSELSRLVARAGQGATPVGSDLFAILDASQRLAARTGGAFDMTAGALTHLWRRARRLNEPPDPARIAEARSVSGSRHLRLDAGARTAEIRRVGVKLDPGGLAKGYAADAARDVLARHGLRRALVVVGGDVSAGDPPPDATGWRVAVESLGPDPLPAIVVSRAAVSTSGDAEQWMTVNGTRYSHVIDPRSGVPVTGRTSATVIAPRGIDADALSTALSVLSREEGTTLIAATPGAAALWQREQPDGTIGVQRSSRWPEP
jgi:thiamine biosynthesis lipoprotein